MTDPVVKVADGAVHRQSPTRMFLPCGDVYGVDTVSNEIYSVDIGNCVGGEAVSYNDTLPAGRQNNVHRQLVELSGGIAQMGRDDFGGSQRDCLVDVRRQCSCTQIYPLHLLPQLHAMDEEMDSGLVDNVSAPGNNLILLLFNGSRLLQGKGNRGLGAFQHLRNLLLGQSVLSQIPDLLLTFRKRGDPRRVAGLILSVLGHRPGTDGSVAAGKE